MKYKIVFAGLFIILSVCSVQAKDSILKNKDKISMELEDVSIPMVLNMIAKEYNLNIVLSDDISGNISLRLEQVDLQTALEAILYPNDFNYYIKNNVIIIKNNDVKAFGELSSSVITLKYIDPITVKTALTSIKSDKGNIIILDKKGDGSSATSNTTFSANKLFITDYPIVLEKMETAIAEMDIEERMISIAVKIIETTIDKTLKVGLNWPTQLNISVDGANAANNITASTGTTGTTSNTTTANSGVLSKNLNSGGWVWGTLSVSELGTVLNLLEQNGNSKLISDPHVTTLENHEAEIKITTVIPIPTISRFTEAAATQDIVTFYDEEVGITLTVTPRINANGKITLTVEPKIEDIIGYTGPADSQKPITISRSVKSKITVLDGETAALGGLLKENKIERIQKVPLLGSIPLIGKLFQSKYNENTTTDLIIMITPTILK